MLFENLIKRHKFIINFLLSTCLIIFYLKVVMIIGFKPTKFHQTEISMTWTKKNRPQ